MSKTCTACGARKERDGYQWCRSCMEAAYAQRHGDGRIREPECDGRCVTTGDLGAIGDPLRLAYRDPECSVHGGGRTQEDNDAVD